MSEGPAPRNAPETIDWFLWGIAGFIFFMNLCDMVNEGRRTAAVIYGALFLVAVGTGLRWRRWAASLLGAGQHEVSDVPNWPIRSLFLHIQPDVQASESHWKAACSEILDKFSTSRLKVWGRQFLLNNQRRNLTPIPAEEWRHARFSNWRMDLNAEQGPHAEVVPTATGAAPKIYVDLQVNKAEALKIWPGPAWPLEILFDPANPNRKFWSLEPAFDPDGKPVGSHWEYRAAIRNKSARTLRNVAVTVEATGPMPTRPQQSLFDLNKKSVIDLRPGEEALVVVRRWYYPPIVVGMAVGEDIYGPIKMVAGADDVLPSTKYFHFDPMKEPMIYEFKNG
jgi:hypothetical protein